MYDIITPITIPSYYFKLLPQIGSDAFVCLIIILDGLKYSKSITILNLQFTEKIGLSEEKIRKATKKLVDFGIVSRCKCDVTQKIHLETGRKIGSFYGYEYSLNLL